MIFANKFNTFVCMSGKQFKKALNLRPDDAHRGIIERLEELSKRDGRSLNNYVIRVLAAHVKKRSNVKT